MFNYLAFVCGGVGAPGQSPGDDGAEMAEKCLRRLEESGAPEQFPPRLLILLTSPAYNDAGSIKRMIYGVRQAVSGYKSRACARVEAQSAEIPLIGCSVEAVFFDRRIHERGALLVCLASRLIEAEARVSGDIHNDHEDAVDDLLRRLGLSILDANSPPRIPLTGRLLLSFLPNIGHHDERVSHLTPDLHRLLLQKARTRIPLVGGVSSRPGFQFAGNEVYRDRIVAASVFTGSPFSSSFGHGTMSGSLDPGDFARVRSEAKRRLARSLRWWTLENPVGCLAIHSSSHRRSGLDLNAIAEDAEELIIGGEAGSPVNGKDVYFGGLFDGEFGADESGRFLFGDWGVATLCFSDEMRDRTPAYTGFKAFSETARSPTGFHSLRDAVKGSLKVIFETGFPGVMLSLVMQNEDDKWLVALGAIGSRFEKIVELTKRPLKENDILAIVARDGNLKFIPDSSQDKYCDQEAIKKSGIISQCVLPLFDRQEDLIATLQFDLGDLRRRKGRLYEAEERILTSLGAVAGDMILRFLNSEEARLARELDKVLIESLRATDLDQALKTYIERATALFEVKTGHIRLINSDGRALEMVAGAGEYYEAFNYLRRKTIIASDSPTARAFKKNHVIVVNDSSKNLWQRAVLDSCGDNPFARSVMQKIRSFANTPIRDANGNPIGTISLISYQPWTFTEPRMRALNALGHRVSNLIEHFKALKERQFLLDINSDFVRNADFTNPMQTMNETVKRLSKAANAEIASLFIWDKEAERFILRAQEGWADKRWVDAARYKKGERWTGGLAFEEAPQYVPNFFVHKKEKALTSDRRKYAPYTFGKPLSEDFTFEAIGLPLRLKKDQTIGVLTLYRRIDPRRPGAGSGFTTTDPRILQEAADTISSMLSALLPNLGAIWTEEEVKRYEAVREAIEKGDPDICIEQRLCRQMVKSFNAEQAVLYLALDREVGKGLCWADAAAAEGRAAPTACEPCEIVISAAKQKRIQEKKKETLAEEEWKAPELAKTEGLIERVALPLLDGRRLAGVLDLHFDAARRQSHLASSHDPDKLEEWGKEIGSVYQRQKELEQKAEAEAQAEKGRLAMQAMGAMVFQTAHRLMNLTQSIRALSIHIEAADSEEAREARLSELFTLIDSSSDVIKRPMEIARQMKEINPRPHKLHLLIDEVRSEVDIRNLSPARIEAPIPHDIMALVDRDLILEAFRNVIHNAMKAMPDGGALTIDCALSDDGREARVTFTDTGVGMSAEQIRAAESGFVTTQRGTGLGVLVSRLLLRAQNGNLDIKSAPGKGTTVTITLPVGIS
jgi:signal transduction histidine kinase